MANNGIKKRPLWTGVCCELMYVTKCVFVLKLIKPNQKGKCDNDITVDGGNDGSAP